MTIPQIIALDCVTGESPLHEAAKKGDYTQFCPQLLTKNLEIWATKNTKGSNPLHLAAKSKTLNQVPTQLLLDTGRKPHEFLDITIDSRANFQNGVTPFQLAIVNGCFLQIPEASVTLERLTYNRKGRRNSLEILAAIGKLGNLPKRFQTPETLMIGAGTKSTLAHIAADAGKIDQIPKAMLTLQSMVVMDKNDQNPIYLAAKEGKYLKQIPIPILSAYLRIKFEDQLQKSIQDFVTRIAFDPSKKIGGELKKYGKRRNSFIRSEKMAKITI